MPRVAKTHSHHVPLAVSVYRRWRTLPRDRISDGTRIAPQIRLASSSARYRFWGRCTLGRFRKERGARFGKEGSSSLRGASRAPFLSQALLAFSSSDFKSLQTSHSAPLLLAFALQILRLSLGRSASREGRCGRANEDANLCKAKGKERRAQNSLAPY
jgi:hypothetical protein